GEVVGFLGTNGAGKTTLFKLLCGLDTPSSGAISICGNNGGTSKVRMHVGYCSQRDALWDSLSAREHLVIYGRLRDLNDGQVMMVIDRLIAHVGLTGKVADRPSAELSGGNRRKLSMAIALVGSPSVILLDEPTAGMDPTSQRPIWELIGKITATKDRAVILTSHNMNEAETVCSRVVFLSRGKVQCVGTTNDIYAWYSPQCHVWVICRFAINSGGGEEVRELASKVAYESPNSCLRLVEIHNSIARYKTAVDAMLPISILWTWLSANKERYHCPQYAVTRSSLSHAFNAMAGQCSCGPA
ncbi:Retinal-specific ATP-binding cassette transporter, partial [Perkinsus olseni]